MCTVAGESQRPKIEEVRPIDDAYTEGLWAISFDGALSRSRAGVGMVFNFISDKILPYSYNLEFVYTNTVAEYEVSLLGLDRMKSLRIRSIKMLGDSDGINQ